jgi:hypothetical protein
MQLRLRPITDPSGATLPTAVVITLVDGAGTPRVGWVVATGEPSTPPRTVIFSDFECVRRTRMQRCNLA